MIFAGSVRIMPFWPPSPSKQTVIEHITTFKFDDLKPTHGYFKDKICKENTGDLEKIKLLGEHMKSQIKMFDTLWIKSSDGTI